MAKKITELVAEVAAPVAQEQGCTLWDVESVREAGQWYLRLYLDTAWTFEAAQGQRLDELDPIEAAISSCLSAGAETALKRPRTFQQFMGRKNL